jgi:formylglycine-generating enzyme required for sulfatase activity
MMTGAMAPRSFSVAAARTCALVAALVVAALVVAGLAPASMVHAASRPPRADRVTIPAGPFTQGSTKGDEDERPMRKVTLKVFAIDRTEVTRADYAACVAARRCKLAPAGTSDPGPPVVGTPATLAAPAAADDPKLPVTGVDWNDAQAYCRFAGGRLPTESEWEKAARGTDGREFPWGEEADCARANWGSFEGEGPCAGKNPGHPVAVGGYPSGASPYGVLDLGGNVWEWVADKYDEDPKRRVVRGGSCCSYFVAPRAANRNAWAPDHRDQDLGFRCAGAVESGGKR